MSDWRPIETAPKDGSTIIGWCREWGEPQTIDWSKGEFGEHWYTAVMLPRYQPTHWMPLPKPPIVGPSKEG